MTRTTRASATLRAALATAAVATAAITGPIPATAAAAAPAVAASDYTVEQEVRLYSGNEARDSLRCDRDAKDALIDAEYNRRPDVPHGVDVIGSNWMIPSYQDSRVRPKNDQGYANGVDYRITNVWPFWSTEAVRIVLNCTTDAPARSYKPSL